MRTQGQLGALKPFGVDDFVIVSHCHRIEIRVVAIYFTLQPVGVDESDREHRAQLVDVPTRSIDCEQSIPDGCQPPRSGTLKPR